jgi:hypothetical protein
MKRGDCSYTDFGALRRHMKQLSSSRTPKVSAKHQTNVVPTGWCHSSHAEGIDGSCSTHVPPTCDLPFRWCFLPERSPDLSVCDSFCGDTSRQKCTRTDQERSKCWNFPFVKKSQRCRKTCWRLRSRIFRRVSKYVCPARRTSSVWHYFLYVI